MPTSLSHTKDALRQQFRAARDALSERDYATRSASVCAQARTASELATASVVHAYWPHTGQREVDTRPLIRSLHAAGVTVALPVVTAFEAPEMTARRFDGADALVPNRWDILEPVNGAPVPTEAIDVVLVPALGVGRNGHRIGHGAGYYDAFLAAATAPTIALTYDATVVPAVPPAPHDVPVDAVATETELFRP
jgi:5-formyltetrahydrofolate cyclo-ligase